MLLRISLRCVYVFMYYQAQPTEMGIAQYFVHRFSRCMSTTIAVWMNVAFSTTEVICGQTSVGSCSFAETKVDARRRLMLHIDMCMHIIYNIYIYVYVYVCIGEYTFIFLLLYVFIYIYTLYIYIYIIYIYINKDRYTEHLYVHVHIQVAQ